jgi:small-conductance mechanosensitive channel
MHMFALSRIAAVRAGLALALITGAACQQQPSVESQKKVDELTKVSNERDRLLAEMSENARMMSEISADLAKVRIPARQLRLSNESPMGAARDSAVQKIRYITARVNETERKLAGSEQRIRELTTLSEGLRGTLQATINNYRNVVEEQKATIVALTDQVAQLTDTVNLLKEQNNTVYYIIGTKDELLQKGIVVQSGGSRFPLLFAKVGQTVVPARELDPAAFTKINKRAVTEIALPEADKTYKIASRQDLAGLATPPKSGNEVVGMLRIANPDRFWLTSRFLIVIRG